MVWGRKLRYLKSHSSYGSDITKVRDYMSMSTSRRINLVAPMYNEQEVLSMFFDAVEHCFSNIDYDYECPLPLN